MQWGRDVSPQTLYRLVLNVSTSLLGYASGLLTSLRWLVQDRPSLNCTSLPLTPCRWFTTRWLNIVSADYLRGGPSCLRGVQGDIGRYLLCMLHHGCLMMSWHQDKPSLVGKQLILTIPCHLLRGGTVSLLVCRGIQGPLESRIGITADSQSCHRVKIVLWDIAPALSSHLPV